MCEVVNSSRFPAPTALTIVLGSQFQKSIRACKRRGKRRSEPPPPIPHAHARIGHGVHRCCQETKGFTQGPPKPFTVFGAPGEPFEVRKRSYRPLGHLRKPTRCLWRHTSKSCARASVSAAWTSGPRLREPRLLVLVSASVTIYLLSRLTH